MQALKREKGEEKETAEGLFIEAKTTASYFLLIFVRVIYSLVSFFISYLTYW